MNKSVRNMFNVLMDAITDANMLVEYAETAKGEGNNQWAEWFKQHAMKRVQMLSDIYNYVKQQLDMESRMAEDDDIAYALDCYIHSQMDLLNKKMNML